MFKLNTKLLAAMAAVLMSLTMTACGGGGGGGGGSAGGTTTSSGSGGATGPAPSSEITASNQEQFAYSSIFYANLAQSYAVGSAASSSAAATTSAVVVATNEQHNILPIHDALTPESNDLSVASVVTTAATNSCSGGGTYTLNKVSGSPTASAVGDKFDQIYANCVEAGTTRNGTVRQELTLLNASSWTYHVSYSAFSFSSATTSETDTGVYDINTVVGASSRTYGITGLSVTGTGVSSGNAITVNVSNSAITTVVPTAGNLTSSPLKLNVSAKVNGTVFGIALDAVIPIVRTIGGVYVSGKLKISGKSSALYLTFLGSDAVRLELDSNGDGVIDGTKLTTVTALLALAAN